MRLPVSQFRRCCIPNRSAGQRLRGPEKKPVDRTPGSLASDRPDGPRWLQQRRWCGFVREAGPPRATATAENESWEPAGGKDWMPRQTYLWSGRSAQAVQSPTMKQKLTGYCPLW